MPQTAGVSVPDRRQIRLGFALAFCAAGALAPLSLGCERDTRARESEGEKINLAGLELKWPLLQRVRYRLQLESSSRTTMPGPPFRLELAAGVDLVPIEAQGARVAVLMLLIEPRLSFEKQRVPDSAPLEAELGRPFWFALENGRIVDGRVSEGVSAQAVSILRTVSSSLQLALPEQQQAGVWQATEFDSTGQYEASYQLSADQTSVRKKKLRFLDTLISGKANLEHRAKVLPEVLQSSAELRVAQGLLKRVELSDELRTTLLGTNQVTVRNELSLAWLAGPEQVDPRTLSVEGELLTLPPSKAYGEQEIRAQFDALRAGGAAFPDVLADLEALERRTDKPRLVASINDEPLEEKQQEAAKAALELRAGLLSKLTGLFRTQPATIEQAEQAILRASPAAGVLADGLAMADTRTSQAALVSLLQAPRLAAKLRPSIAMSLIRVRSPSPESVAFLRSRIADPELKDHAVYGLGTAARRLHESGSAADAQAIVDELVNGLQQAKSSKERFRWLRGIANSASATALPAVLPFLEDRDDRVRQAALESLRLVRDPRVEGIVKDRLKTEKDPAVRRAVVRLAERQSVSDTLVATLSLTAKNDADPTVRRAALLLLEQWLPQRESLRPLVDELKAAAARIEADMRKPAP